MASLTIRNIPDEVKRRFRLRAAEHGRSMEEEARQLILQATSEESIAGGVAERRSPYSPPKPDAPTTPRKSIGQMLYEGSRPGIELPDVPDTPASFATFDDE